MGLLARLLGRTSTNDVTWLEVDDLAKVLGDALPPRVVDVRGPGEFTGPLGHIDDAENIPLDQIQDGPQNC